MNDLIEKTHQAFFDYFAEKPSFLVRSPGRVNLLGEHTDYNGLPVLPMAIDHSIVIAGCARNDNQFHVVAHDFNDENVTFKLGVSIPKHPQGHWVNYVKAGIKGLLDKMERKDVRACKGCDLYMMGDIPYGSGLSSSSALVVASALCFLQANYIPFHRSPLAVWMAEAEYYVGTRGGGMDQATCLLGESDHLLKLDFFPLRATQIPWDPNYSVVICDSGVRAQKSENALQAYNFRSAECRLGKLLIDSFLKRSGQSFSWERLGDLLQKPHNYTYSDLDELARRSLKEVYSFDELISELGDKKAAVKILKDCSIGPASTYSKLEFSCGKRFRHIISDGWRVEQSRESLMNQDMKKFGECMLKGHQSARDDFAISCKELNDLVESAMESGSLGSRLTGAGFGGCTINLVPKKKVNNFVKKMESTYYRDRAASQDPRILITQPSNGAEILICSQFD
ncbi:MAG: galactokinase [Candidatus Omnitrophica bacterium]|nr:galactokinase [Candidatus Omnitrophota bacterium]